MLIQWGCDLADQNGVAAYLDAHIDAAPLHRKFGFRDRDDIGVSSDGAVPMIERASKTRLSDMDILGQMPTWPVYPVRYANFNYWVSGDSNSILNRVHLILIFHSPLPHLVND